MAVPQMFINLKPKRSILERTRNRPELPKVALYLGELSGQMKRRVLDADGAEQVIADKVLASNYRLASLAKSKELMESYWPKLAEENQKN